MFFKKMEALFPSANTLAGGKLRLRAARHPGGIASNVQAASDAGSLAMKAIDGILPISGPESIPCSKDLATQEGIFVGITSGETFAGALKIAAEAEK